MNYEIKRLSQNELKYSKERILSLMQQLTPGVDETLYLQKYDEFKKYVMDGSAIVFVALVDGIIQGYIWGYNRINHGSDRIHVTQFVVDCQYRNFGIGRKLMEEMNRYSLGKGYSSIELNVLPYNINAIRFYFSFGFVPEHIFMKNDCAAPRANRIGNNPLNRWGGGICHESC